MVQPLIMAMRTWISETWPLKSGDMRRCLISFTQCILVSTQLLPWHPHHRRYKARPGHLEAWRVILRGSTISDGLSRLGLLAGRDDTMGAPVNGGIVALPLFAGAVSGAAADLIAFQVRPSRSATIGSSPI